MTLREEIRAVLDPEFQVKSVKVDKVDPQGVPSTQVQVTWKHNDLTFVSISTFALANKMSGEHMGEVLASYMRHELD